MTDILRTCHSYHSQGHEKMQFLKCVQCKLDIAGNNRGENQALVGAIPFCGEYPGPRFEDNFDQLIKWMEFQKLVDIKWLPVNL